MDDSGKNPDDLKIYLESRLLEMMSPPICIDPAIRVSQISNLINYNKKKAFARKLDSRILWNRRLSRLSTYYFSRIKA